MEGALSSFGNRCRVAVGRFVFSLGWGNESSLVPQRYMYVGLKSSALEFWVDTSTHTTSLCGPWAAAEREHIGYHRAYVDESLTLSKTDRDEK